jgi:hypothetical protein
VRGFEATQTLYCFKEKGFRQSFIAQNKGSKGKTIPSSLEEFLSALSRN